MSRGKKKCPDCGTEQGVRTWTCSCGHEFYPGQTRKVVAPTNPSSTGKKGMKGCPKCGADVGGRTWICNCGYNFYPDKQRKTVAPKKSMSERKKGKGYKQCPSCAALCGMRTYKCTCGFDFTSVVKPVKEKKQKKKTKKTVVEKKPEVCYAMPAYVAPKRLTAKGHAQRILSYGKDRALLLLQFAKLWKCWSHVDWDVVEAGLS